MKTVATLLDAKGSEVYSVGPDATVYEALELMADKNVGALVIAEHNRLRGILFERDYARKVILRGRTSADTRVSEIMTTDVRTVAPTGTIDDCMELMTAHRIRHLPVLDGDEIVGMISIGDVVKEAIAHLASMVEQLESYIRGV